jgi:uncharacterized membrane protein
LDQPSWRYVLISAATLALATAIPDLSRRLAGAFELGVCLSFVFFAAIAAGADVPAMLSVAPMLVVLVLILLSVSTRCFCWSSVACFVLASRNWWSPRMPRCSVQPRLRRWPPPKAGAIL